jgi:hypothetical protein
MSNTESDKKSLQPAYKAELSEAYEPKLISLTSEVSVRRERSLSPLAALFPAIGDAQLLRSMSDKLNARLEALRIESEGFGEKSLEESMLRQVLEWLSQTEAS